MITETRYQLALPVTGDGPAKRCFTDLAVHPHFASDSAFFASQGRKLYFFTTLYVDVKEPAVSDISSDKKTQLCLPTGSFPLARDPSCRDKIECNLQSQNIEEHTSSTFVSEVPVAAGR